MGTLTLKNTERTEQVMSKLMNAASLFTLLVMALMIAFPETFAQGADAKKVIQGLLQIVYLITNVVGVIFVIIGFVKLAIAYANEDGPSQQKAALFIATGLILVLIRLVLKGIKFEDWVVTKF